MTRPDDRTARSYARELGWDYKEMPEWMSLATVSKLCGFRSRNAAWKAVHTGQIPATRAVSRTGAVSWEVHRNDLLGWRIGWPHHELKGPGKRRKREKLLTAA